MLNRTRLRVEGWWILCEGGGCLCVGTTPTQEPFGRDQNQRSGHFTHLVTPSDPHWYTRDSEDWGVSVTNGLDRDEGSGRLGNLR